MTEDHSSHEEGEFLQKGFEQENGRVNETKADKTTNQRRHSANRSKSRFSLLACFILLAYLFY